MKNKQLSRSIFIICGTLLVFALGYYLYIEVYTKGKEAHIIATKSRILEQMSQNLKDKVKSMESNAAEYAVYLMTLAEAQNLPEKEFINMLKQKKDINYFNPDLEYVIDSEHGYKYKVPKDSKPKVKSEAKSDFLYFQVEIGGKTKKKKLDFRANYESLMTGFMQRNIFNEYILIIDDTIIFSSLPGKPNLVFTNPEKDQSQGAESGFRKSSSPGNLDIITQTKPEQVTIKGVTTYDINISNKPYKLFVCQTQVENRDWYFCGLVKTELIDQAKKEMAPWLFFLIFMILTLIILGLPFIKLKVMSVTEQLTSGNLVNSAISLFLGTSFIFLFIFFVSNTYWYRLQNESSLNRLSKEIKNSLKTEIKSAWNQLVTYDSICLMRTGLKKDLSDYTNILIENELKPESYSYFDYSFYIDTLGEQKGILTPFSIRDKPTNLSTRDYFKKPDEWIFPSNDTCRFRMESIVSLTSGVVKAALSKRSVIENMVIAMTGRFYSVIDPLMADDYKFCIIDGKGLVWFHSDKLRNLQENLITECNEDENLSAAIYANASKTLNVYYYDEPYRIHVESLAPVPLYLVTMYDKHAEYAYQVQVMMLTLLLFSALVFFIIIQTVALFFFKGIVKYSGWKNLIMDFIGAKEDHNMIYLVMSILLVLTAILYFLLIDPENILVPLIYTMVMSSFLFPYLSYAINKFSFKSSSLRLFVFLNAVFIILINIASYKYMNEGDFYKLLIFQEVILLLLLIGFLVLKKDFTLKYKHSTTIFYVCFLLGLLLAFSVAPSIKFFQASVSHEIIRGIKHDQLELARLRESRNTQFRKYYTLMEQNHKLDPSVISVFEQRMDSGIYTKFTGSTFHIKGKASWKEMDISCMDSTRGNKFRNIERGEFIINNFRPIYDRTSIETKFLQTDSLLNGKQYWCRCNNSIVFNYLSISEKYNNLSPDSCRIITSFKRPDIFNPLIAEMSPIRWPRLIKYEIIFILILLFVLFGIYRLILFGTRKLFGISIIEMHTEYNFGNFICERIAAGQSVMIIRSPSENPVEYIKDHLKAKHFNLTSLDIIKQGRQFGRLRNQEKMDVLIIENFAFDYYSQDSLTKQLEKINEKIRQKFKMVIMCTNAPYLIQDYLVPKVKPGKNVKEKPDELPGTSEQLLLLFNNILANVNILYTPEKYNQKVLKPKCYLESDCTRILVDYTGNQDKNMKCFICRELAASSYLHKYAGEVMGFYDNLVKLDLLEKIIKDRIISRIMDLGRLYYDNILSSCSPMERFVLSDMAHDMIVNSKNQTVVLLLIHRGLFVTGGCTIRFMNESFRKHVILRFTDEERNKLKEKLGDSGMSWQGYKLVLILVMIGLFSFMFIANRAIIDNLNKLFIVITGGIALITNLAGLLTRKETGST